jgi:ABC-type bacteriocin/lantibiotic exporter with double-glycine peptidase domain
MRRRFLVPEVIQTSAMDCGPAALKALFGGFGVYLSYGRLREACQTDVDGTSMDTLEDIALQLGLGAEQMIVPADLLLLETSGCVPAIVVMRLPDGAPHFVVVWRVHGALVQLMDPASGRIWMDRRRFLASLYIHEQPVGQGNWDEWCKGPMFTAGLKWRLRALGAPVEIWDDRAHLDASLRLAHALAEAGKLKHGAEARELLKLCARNPEQIPDEFWTFRNERMRGAVLIAAAGPVRDTPAEGLPDSLAAVRSEPAPRVWIPVWEAARSGGWLLPGIIGLALLAAAAGTVFAAVLFRGWLDLAEHLKLSGQRMGAVAGTTVFLAVLLSVEWPATLGLLRLGRHLELRLRVRYLLKLPRLSDRYFQSRLISDMAFRAHALVLLRELPEVAGQLTRLGATMTFTALAIGWLYPGAAAPAALATAATVSIPLLFQPALMERDLRFREISSSLSRFYLDALLGIRAIQAHCAGPTLRAAQAGQLRDWAGARLRQHALVVRAEAAQAALTLALVIGLVYSQAMREPNPAGLLLLAYWAVSIPAMGRQFAAVVWSLPGLRNTLLRFLEPMGSREQNIGEIAARGDAGGVNVSFDHVKVIAAGHVLLDDITATIAPGEHVAIVGSSGSGKSSLVGLLLGWYQSVSGSVRVDDSVIDDQLLARVRRETAWIDPQVHLSQTTLFENLRYGNDDAAPLESATEIAGLADVLERLPDGLQTGLGEGGALLSGGEGQRVRIGRALARSGVRLAVLDEPARGLDRQRRREFIADARRHFAGATLFYITHDIADTLDFDRVLVMDQGCLVEQAPPRELYVRSGSRYRALLDGEESVRRHLWSHPLWRRLWLSRGVLSENIEAGQWTHA